MSEQKKQSEFLFDRSHKLFINFLEHTDQADNAIRYMSEKISNMLLNISETELIRYLDVGCGYGYKTRAIVELIKKSRPIKTTAIDPSEKLIELFQEKPMDDNIHFSCATWEEFEPKSDFHLITSIHTFYYIQEWKAAIEKMIECCDKKGVICIAIRTNDQICQFKNHFFKKINSSNKNEPNFKGLCDVLSELKVNFKTDIIDSHLNINDCLAMNEKGEQLIEFLLRRPYADLPNALKHEIRDYLEENQQNGYLKHQDGFAWIVTN